MRKHHLMTILICAAVSFAVARYAVPGASTVPETAFDRVMRTGKLRCGYFTIPPVTIRDPNTGQLSGLSVDMMNYFTAKTGINVEWSEEINFATWVPALQAGRFDALCTPIWVDLAQGRVAKFTRAMVYSSVVPLVRKDETRFGPHLADLNREDVTIVTQEGNSTDVFARTTFPRAKFVTLPQISDYGSLIQMVLQHKADVVLWDRNGYYDYEKTNPGQIKILDMDRPVKVMPCSLATLQKDGDLRDLLDQTIDDMQNAGELDRLIDKWEAVRGTYLRTSLPYQLPKAAN